MTMPRTLTGDTTLHLPEFDTPPDNPLELLRRWIADAEHRDVREPLAASLATATTERVTSRTVLIKRISDDGPELSFSTHSRKGQDLSVYPHAALNLYWRETLQQITVEGVIRMLPAAASDAIWEERPRGARAASSTAHQSAELTDEAALLAAARALADSDQPIPRPEHWHAFVLVPTRIEFWHGSPDRMHRRREFTRATLEDRWSSRRLHP